MEIKGFKRNFENQVTEDKKINNKLCKSGAPTAPVFLRGSKLALPAGIGRAVMGFPIRNASPLRLGLQPLGDET